MPTTAWGKKPTTTKKVNIMQNTKSAAQTVKNTATPATKDQGVASWLAAKAVAVKTLAKNVADQGVTLKQHVDQRAIAPQGKIHVSADLITAIALQLGITDQTAHTAGKAIRGYSKCNTFSIVAHPRANGSAVCLHISPRAQDPAMRKRLISLACKGQIKNCKGGTLADLVGNTAGVCKDLTGVGATLHSRQARQANAAGGYHIVTGNITDLAKFKAVIDHVTG